MRESHQRIESALRALNLHWPGKQVVINMAPTDIRKEGSVYDFPPALDVAAAGGHNIIISEHPWEGLEY